MKGPGLRIDHDVRRVWECPNCGARALALGDVVARRCGCQPNGVFMRLLEEKKPAVAAHREAETAQVSTPNDYQPEVSTVVSNNSASNAPPAEVDNTHVDVPQAPLADEQLPTNPANENPPTDQDFGQPVG